MKKSFFLFLILGLIMFMFSCGKTYEVDIASNNAYHATVTLDGGEQKIADCVNSQAIPCPASKSIDATVIMTSISNKSINVQIVSRTSGFLFTPITTEVMASGSTTNSLGSVSLSAKIQ